MTAEPTDLCRHADECGLPIACRCDCCIEKHPCECREDDEDDYPGQPHETDHTEVTHPAARTDGNLNEPTLPRPAADIAGRGCSTGDGK